MRFFLLFFLAALGACATERYLPKAQTLDSVRAGAIASLRPHKVVVRGPLIMQAGTGNVASIADNRKAGQRQGAAATARDASASNASKSGGVAWYWLVVAALVGAVGWEVFSAQAAPLKWLPWRARPSDT